MMELTEVTKIYNRGAANEFASVRGVSLSLSAGEALILKGPSGSGKTSLLSLMGCMNRPTSGRIHIKGGAIAELLGAGPDTAVDVSTLPERFLTLIRRRMFGFVFQQFNLVRGISALENVMLPVYPTGEQRSAIRERAQSLLDGFGVGHRAAARVEQLSGGEQQRVAIARALINQPLLLIADEPTAHLDTALSREFLSIAASLKVSGTTLIIASHDPLVYGAGFVDRVLEMRDGLLVAAGDGA
jgi:putative ABC transport system ATP-binding protein